MGTLFSGMIHVTGEPDTGKTTFALECGAEPSKIAFIDDDVKGRATVEQLGGKGNFAIYHDLIAETRGMKELEFHAYGMKIVNEILDYPGEIDAVIWDTWARFEASFKPYVNQYPAKFKNNWSKMGELKGAEEWIEAQRYETDTINALAGKARLVILITHLKQYRVGGKEIAGKYVPRGQAPLIEKSLFRLWLRQNPSGRPVPIGLVLKRLSLKRLTDRGIRTTNILPRRLVPRPEDESLWDTINWYYDNPVGDRPPTADEVPNAFELSILDGGLTPDQRLSLELALHEAETQVSNQEATLINPETEIMEQIRAYRAQNPSANNTEIMTHVAGATVGLIIKSRVAKDEA